MLKTDTPPRLSRTAWFDLPVKSLSDAMSFYEGLLGWTYRQMEESPVAHYVMIEAAGELIGGLRQVAANRQTGETPILYFTVDNLQSKVGRAKELGAEIVGQVVHLGRDRGSYQWIRDREGNLIGLWASA